MESVNIKFQKAEQPAYLIQTHVVEPPRVCPCQAAKNSCVID